MGSWHEGVRPSMLLRSALMLFFWGGLVGLIVWGIARFARRSPAENEAVGIARERYARGETVKEEFDRIKKDLT